LQTGGEVGKGRRGKTGKGWQKGGEERGDRRWEGEREKRGGNRQLSRTLARNFSKY